VVGRRQRLLGVRDETRVPEGHAPAACARSPTSRPSPIRTPGLAVYDTTPNPYGIPPGWLIIAAPARRRRSSPARSGWPQCCDVHAGLRVQARVVGVRRDRWLERLLRHDYLCTAKKGYDGPTGVGTPNGIGAL